MELNEKRRYPPLSIEMDIEVSRNDRVVNAVEDLSRAGSTLQWRA